MAVWRPVDSSGGAAARSVAGWSLVVPAVSVGNVGQLAVDALLATLPRADRIGYIHSGAVMPAVAAAARDEPAGAILPVEVYACEPLRLVVVQRRSPCVPGRRAEFAEALAGWAATAGLSRALLLDSRPAHTRGDEELRAQARPPAVVDDAPGPFGRAFAARGVPLAAAIAYASDGDNAPDALAVAPVAWGWAAADGRGPQPPREWRVPASWEGVFGAPPDPDMYC